MNQQDDRILLAHIQDFVRRGAYRSFTAFLDQRQYMLAKAELRAGTYRFFGGYPDAERGILCIHPEDLSPTDEEYPISCLTFTFPEAYQITHRDVLGSLMAQQIQRDTVGDILVTSGRVQCFVTGAAIATGLSLTKIGRVGVKVTDAIPFADDYHQNIKEYSGTITTPRLDAVLRTALNQGRGQCLVMIRSGLVTLNYQEILQPDKLLKAGDVFSVRGHGKFRLKEVGEPTKKGRLHITIEQFL